MRRVALALVVGAGIGAVGACGVLTLVDEREAMEISSR